MADAITVKVHGTRELEAKLRRLGEQMSQCLPDAVMAGALPVVAEIVKRTPVRTGNLRRSYHAELGRVTRHTARAIVGTDVEYAPYVEFGTSRMSARPHLRPGVTAGAPIFAREAARALERCAKAAS